MSIKNMNKQNFKCSLYQSYMLMKKDEDKKNIFRLLLLIFIINMILFFIEVFMMILLSVNYLSYVFLKIVLVQIIIAVVILWAFWLVIYKRMVFRNICSANNTRIRDSFLKTHMKCLNEKSFPNLFYYEYDTSDKIINIYKNILLKNKDLFRKIRDNGVIIVLMKGDSTDNYSNKILNSTNLYYNKSHNKIVTGTFIDECNLIIIRNFQDMNISWKYDEEYLEGVLLHEIGHYFHMCQAKLIDNLKILKLYKKYKKKIFVENEEYYKSNIFEFIAEAFSMYYRNENSIQNYFDLTGFLEKIVDIDKDDSLYN